MKLLVAGSDRVDAGKTTFSVGLLERTSAQGFKPRAGNNYWFDHDDYQRATSEGRLYGKDAKRLAAASPSDVAPEELNPIHRLWHPSPGAETGLLGKENQQFVVDRVGRPSSETGVEYVVNGTVDLPESVSERLPLANAPRVTSVADFNDLMRVMHVEALDSLAADIEATDRAVVESYGDVARPLSGIEPDAVAVVEPGRAASTTATGTARPASSPPAAPAMANWRNGCRTSSTSSSKSPRCACPRSTASSAVTRRLSPMRTITPTTRCWPVRSTKTIAQPQPQNFAACRASSMS